jgi:hypothetical protein
LALITIAASVLVPLVIVACGEDETATPECPELPLFNVHDLEDGGTDEAKAAYEKWKASGCVTPAGTAVDPDAAFIGG